MSNPIPDFDHNLVLPPHLGSPTSLDQLSPYPCTTLDLVEKFGTSDTRREILRGFLKFRERLRTVGLNNGFQWIDGSFLEDVELRENRSPRDLDVVTVYWSYDLSFQKELAAKFPEFGSPALAKANFHLDHYPLDADFKPAHTVEFSRYWALLFSHNRAGVWKGMLKIDLNTPTNDAKASHELDSATK